MINKLTKDFGTDLYQPPDVVTYVPAHTATLQSPLGGYTGAVDPTAALATSLVPVFGYAYDETHTTDVTSSPLGMQVLLSVPNGLAGAGLVSASATHSVSTGSVSITYPAYNRVTTPPPVAIPIVITGWDGSASSIGSSSGNLNAQFSVTDSSYGVVAGLVRSGNETGSGYATIEYAIYASDGFYQVIENGATKTPKFPFTTSQVFTIQKQSTTVQYLLDGVLVYNSLISSSAVLTMVLDVSFYASGDSILDASIMAGLHTSGWVGGSVTYTDPVPVMLDPVVPELVTPTPLDLDNELPPAMAGWLEVTPLTSHLWLAPSSDVSVLYPVPLFLTPNLPEVNLPVVQSIDVSPLTLDHSAPSSSVSQASRVVATNLSVGWAVTSATVKETYSLQVTPLSAQLSVPAATTGQIYTLQVAPLNLAHRLSVYGANSNVIGGVNYLGVALTTDQFFARTYSNFPFVGSCQFGKDTLFINKNGLYKLGGSSDDGDSIVPSLKTGKMDTVMGFRGPERSNKWKRIVGSKVRVSCDKVGGIMDLNVTDNTQTYNYTDCVAQDVSEVTHIFVGHGIKYNYIQFELVADGCSLLNIDAIEYDPAELSGSER